MEEQSQGDTLKKAMCWASSILFPSVEVVVIQRRDLMYACKNPLFYDGH